MEVSRVQTFAGHLREVEQRRDATLLELMTLLNRCARSGRCCRDARAADPPAEARGSLKCASQLRKSCSGKGIYTPLKWRTDRPVETKPQPEAQSENVVSKEEPPQTGNVAETVAVGPKNGKANAEAVEPDEPIENTAEIVAAEPQKQEEAANNTVELEGILPRRRTPEAYPRVKWESLRGISQPPFPWLLKTGVMCLGA